MKHVLIILLGLFTVNTFASADLAEDGKWLAQYYKHPAPGEIATKLLLFQKDGLFDNPRTKMPMLGFFSRVMRDNPSKIEQWLHIAESFSEADKQTVFTAAWLANTEQSKNFFKSHDVKQLLDKTPPDINNLPINDSKVLDFYWATYSASGDPNAIRRIISALEFEKDAGAVKKYKSSEHTEADKQAAYHDAIFQAAMWSLTSNCSQDEKIYSICQDWFNSGKLTKPEEMFLGIALSKANPDKVKIETSK